MKRTLILILVCIIAAAAFAAPQRPAPNAPPQVGPGGPHEQGILPPAAIAEFLSLSDAQIEQIKALREALKATVDPLRDQARTNREALEAAVQAGDAAKAGQLAIAGYNIRQQIRAAHESFETSFVGLLNAEQKAKWSVYQEIVALRKPHPRD